MRMYSCQIYDNGTLVRDFVPCVDYSGEVGMYDLVSAVFYGSSGTGAFTAGSPSSEEYTDITPVMTSANTPAGYAVTASSTHTISQPWMAFDGITSSTSDAWRVWHSAPGVPQWIMLEFPEAVEVSAFSITNRANFGDYDTKGILSFSLEGSNNGTSFTTLGTYTRAGDYALTTVHPVGTPGEYRYYRIYVTQCGYVYSGSQYAVVEEIRFYETAKTVPDAPEELTAAYASGSVTLTWTAAEDAAGYRIYADGVPVGDTAETSFTYTGAEIYGVYTYTVTAYNEYGEGDGTSVRVRIPGSSDVLADLITDRTAEDIWNRTAKGVYNARDLNRVSTAAAYVRSMLADYGYLCGTDARADWKANEIPRTSDLQAHHLSVTALDVIRYAHDPVRLPASLEKLTWEDANAIEAFLLSCGRAAERIPESWVFAGECICGEI
ncbi:MAG: discoidin domain-containing protein [Clostridia bacterium]|nr:discoidin domain-containing protein [Clostridia bacterium]